MFPPCLKRNGGRVLISFCSRVFAPHSAPSAHVDVQFEVEAKVMPLMSAAKVWADLKSSVPDENVFKTVNTLLFVQVIADRHSKVTQQVGEIN